MKKAREGFLRSRYSLRFFCPQCGSIRIKEEGRLVG